MRRLNSSFITYCTILVLYTSRMNESDTTILDVNQSVWNFFIKRHPFVFLFLILLPVFISVGVAYFGFSQGIFQQLTGDGPFVIILLPLLVSLITYIVVRSKIEKTFYTQLATALGCTYQPDLAPPATGQFAKMMSTSRRFFNVLSGTYLNLPFQLGDYTYDTGSGKNRVSHPYTLGIVTLNTTLPHVVCVPKSWASIIFDQWKPSGTKTLPLEGDFNSAFTVFVPEGSEIEALQVLEPYVMEKLMQGFSNFGFECIDSRVYLFTKGSMKENREAVMHLYTLLQRFCDVLTPELHTLNTPT